MSAPRRLLAAVLLLAVTAHAAALESRVRARVAGDGPFWVGQRIVVEVDLLSTGFTFSDQRFELPDLPGVVLLAPGSATLNLTERIDGETWQGLRYELSLFVLGPRTLDVPPIGASFAVSAGYGSTPQRFRLETVPLRVEVALPPGAADVATLVTTPKLEVTAAWEPQPGALKVGDAFTLTLHRRAVDVPGAAIPPLEFSAPDGLAVYPAAPEIDDRTGRGTLTGERVDRVSYVMQSPGDYTLPGQVLHWYDPTTGTLHEETIDALELSVAPNADAPPGGADGAATAPPGDLRTGWMLAAAALAVAGLAVAGRRVARVLRDSRRARRAAREASEPGRFAALLSACRRGDARAADHAAAAWLRVTGERARTLTELARGDAALAQAAAQLQAALVGRCASWSGGALASRLTRHRHEWSRRESGRLRRPLPPLNPAA